MSRRALLFVAFFVLVLMVPVTPAHAGGFCHEGGNTQDETTRVDMQGNCFYPAVTHIEVGDKITWTNNDPENHVIVGVGGSWGTPEVTPQSATALRFDEPGTYPYWCHIHLGMVGAVVVGDGRATEASAGGAGGGPVATLAAAVEATSETDEILVEADEAAVASTEPIEAEAATADGIDWGSLAIAGVLIVALAAFGASPPRNQRPAGRARPDRGTLPSASSADL